MDKLKVFGGLLVVAGGRQKRTIVACSSQKKAAELVGLSIGYFRDYWTDTGNSKELEIALSMPGVVFQEKTPNSREFEVIELKKVGSK